MNALHIRHPNNQKMEVTVYDGHFATRHSHNTHYIDITRMKHEHTMAREAAMWLAQRYAYEKGVDTIVCLDGSEVIGAFLARHLAKGDRFSVNQDKNINVITPEYDSNGQLIFRDNLAPMVSGKNVLILISTVNSGKTVARSLECVQYYGGQVQGIAAIFTMSRWGTSRYTASLRPPISPAMPATSPSSAPCAKKASGLTLWPTASASPSSNLENDSSAAPVLPGRLYLSSCIKMNIQPVYAYEYSFLVNIHGNKLGIFE